MKKDWMIKESELDDIQRKVLVSVLDKSCIVSGGAGSGKSVLALIKAQRIQKEKGNNYQIIVFTKALCNYMSSGREVLGLQNNFLYHKEWRWKKFLKRYANGTSYMVYERDENGNKIPNMPHADYTIVDEIQDFTQDEIHEFIRATDGTFFFFGDTAQSIFHKPTIPVDQIGIIIPEARTAKEWVLYYNYRLPLPVARFVYPIGLGLDSFDESVYKSAETAIPRVVRFETKETQLEAIHRIIDRNNMDDVAVLLPDNESVINTYNGLSKLGGNYELRYNDTSNFKNNKDNLNFNSTNPKIMTYHSAKGLQFETVFIPFIEDFIEDGDTNQKALYVAMTRTYRNLYVLFSGQLPSPLSKIDTSLYKTTEIDTIADM